MNRKPDEGELGGDYARDSHRGGYGDDYARDGGWSGGGRADQHVPDHEGVDPADDEATIADGEIGKASE